MPTVTATTARMLELLAKVRRLRDQVGPLLSVWAAATRQTLGGKVLGPDERIEVADALKMVTIGAAYLMFQDEVKGSITPGKLADFAVLAEDPLAVPVDHVRDIKVLGTVLGGKVLLR